MAKSQEERLLEKLERLIRAGDTGTSAFVAEQLRGFLQRELETLDAGGALSDAEKDRKLELIRRIADVHLTMGETDTAREYYDKVLSLAPESVSAARAHAKLGEAARVGAAWKEALRHLDQGIRIFRKTGRATETAELVRGKAYVAWRQGRLAAAKRLMEEAKDLAQKHNQPSTLAAVYIELGNLANDAGEIDDARRDYQEAIDMLKKHDPGAQLARAYNNLGDTYIKVKDWEGAIPFFEETLKVARRIRDKQWMGWGAFNAAECYAHVGQPRRSKEYCDLALQLLTEKGDKIGIANVYVNYGIAYRFLKDWPQMAKHFEEGIARYEELGVDTVVAYSALQYAEALLEKGDKRAALSWARKAVERYRRAQASVYLAEAQSFLDELRAQTE